MSTKQGEVKYVPYQQDGEPPRRAAVTTVDFPLDGLSDNDLQILGHLVEAAEAMNPIFRYQYEPRTFIIRPMLKRLIKVAEGEEKEKLQHYLTLLDLQNSPYALLPRKNHLLQISRERLYEIAEKACDDCNQRLNAVIDLLTEPHETPDKAHFYPDDFTDEEFEAIEKHPVNSRIMRDVDGKPIVVLNEVRYKKALKPAIKHLRAARDLAEDPGLRLYLDAKITELEHGSTEARRVADFTWIRHNNPVDIVISTALEVYLDNYRNARGAATGGVYVRNREADELLQALVERVSYWEANAPWTHKRTEIDPETLPKLKFVDVLAWSGDQVTGPFTTIAQSLPNDEWVMRNVGTVNMVYLNTGKAVHRVAGQLAAEEFLTKDEFEQVKDHLFQANQLHSALHEIGHTTGMMASELKDRNANEMLQEEYSFLEESRAELFGLWSLQKLVEDKVLDATTARACYDGMLVTMVTSLKFDPVQAHNKARNGMFHWFEAKGIIERVEENGKLKFRITHDTAHETVHEMLGQIGDIKAHGKKDEAISLREANVHTDDLKEQVEERTADFPLGRGLIFPRLKKDTNGRYLRELEYPDHFSDQIKFNLEPDGLESVG